MQQCYYINPENRTRDWDPRNIKVAVIARPDSFMEQSKAVQLVIETERNVHTRCYLAQSGEVPFLIVYGRFKRTRSTSRDIDFEGTQHVLSFLGIRVLVGTFVTGSIDKDARAGGIYVPHDFVGMGGYNQSRHRETGFRNVDMFTPFCGELRDEIAAASDTVPFSVSHRGVYVCFHGYPRIETSAELEFYCRMGWSIVGQTLDPEATLAREAGVHYVAMAVTIDDWAVRDRFLKNDPTARLEIEDNIRRGRENVFSLFLRALPRLHDIKGARCNCVAQGTHVQSRSKSFHYRPAYLDAMEEST